MEIYFFLFSLCFFLFTLQQYKYIDNAILAKVLLCLLIILSGSRYYVGTDYKTYISLFESVLNGNETYMEMGFEAIAITLFHFGFVSQAIFLFCSAITLYFIWKFIKLNSNNSLDRKSVV